MNNFREKGEALEWTNDTGSDVDSGDVVVLGDAIDDPATVGGVLAAGRIGVAVTDIADTKVGALAMVGVFELAKLNTDDVEQGDPLYWDAANSRVTKTAAANVPAGYAYSAAGNPSTSVLVKIG